MMKRRFIALCFSLCGTFLFLSGCENNWLGEAEPPPLPGKRISVLELQKDLQPDPVLSNGEMVIPPAWNNKFWPQAGGYPNHSMGHLGLAHELERDWVVSIGEGGSRRVPLTTQPIVVDNVIYTLDSRAQVTALDSIEGRRLWRVSAIPEGEDEDEEMLGGGIAFSDGYLFVTSGYNEVRALNPESGKTVWVQKTPAPTRAAPTALDGRVFVLTLDNQILALSAQTGQMIWNQSAVAESTSLLGTASPAANRNIAVAAFSSGELFAMPTENGRVIWTDTLGAVQRVGVLSSIAEIRGLPVIDKGVVYAISYNGRMVAIDQRTGARIWQREIGGAETPWVAGDSIYLITSDSQLVALDRRNGEIRWLSKLPRFEDPEKETNRLVWLGPVLAGERLVMVSSEGDIYEIRPETGELFARWKMKGRITVPPVVADNTLYLLTEDGDLFAYR